MIRKTVKYTAIIFFCLIGIAFATPLLFKGKILELVKREMNKNINAKANFSDVDISFIRHFPKASVIINDLSIAGIDEFSGDTLISAKKIDLALNLMSIIRGSSYKIYSITVDRPRINAIVHKNGNANWAITKATKGSTDISQQKPFQLSLEKYSITNGYIKYEDASSNMGAEVINLNHEGNGDFTSDLFTLKTITSADAVSFRYGAIPYLAKTKTMISADIQVDNKINKYSFKTDNVLLNDLKLTVEGFFQLVNDSVYKMDIAYKAPSTDFKNILSLVPAIYSKDFATVKTSGQAVFQGFVKGTYSNTQLPAYHINLEVKNGFFQYPDLPKPLKDINFGLLVNNPDGVTDHTVITIPQGHIEMDNDPFDFHLLVKNPVSDQYIDAAAKGKIDLSKISQYVKLEPGTKLDGLLDADLAFNGNVSAIEKKQYDKFNAKGSIGLQNFFYASKDYPGGITLHSAIASFNPHNVTLSAISGQYLKTNFSANGFLDNLLPYVLKNEALSGIINVKADKVNLDDWMGTNPDTATKNTAAAMAFAVPANLNITINATVDKVHYDKTDLDNLSGSLGIKNETVQLNNVKSNAFDGTILLNGSYSTRESKKKPDISLTYDVQNLDVQKTFYAVNTFQKLMPIGQFIAGKLSSHLSMTGKLGDNMMPDLSSLTGNGNLLLIEGFLKKFAPLDKLASTLNVDQLKDISLKDVKNYIEFANGKVLIKPFTTKVKNIEMEIGGMHGFDQSLDYTINLKIPRAMMGAEGNNLINNLAAQAENKGIPVKLGDMIPLKVNMLGTIKNPIIKTDLKQSASSLASDLKQQALDFAKSKKDSAKKALTDTVASFKSKLVADAKNELTNKLLGNKDSTTKSKSADINDIKKQAADAGKGLLNGLFKKKVKDTTGG